jgi:predicted transcriptional regulator
VPKRHDNTIYKLFLRNKKTIKVIISSITRIGLIVRIEDPKEAPGVDYVYIEEDTEVEETTIADIATTTHPIRSNTISIINLDTS